VTKNGLAIGDGAKNCFVIMPFGEKADVDGKLIDFDKIYDTLIREAVEGAPMRDAGGPPIKCIRCDRIAESGWVHRQMISNIMDDEIAVVDLSTLNPNVFYELGVRHALRQRVTVLVRRAGTTTPFNLAGFKSIDYDVENPVSLSEARRKIAEYIVNGLNGQVLDSLVYEVLRDRHLEPTPAARVNPGRAQLFKLRNAPKKRVGILTGDMRHVTGIDVWVNSENTDMQMARYYDRSGSAVMRYFGAKRDRAGQVVEDTIANELAAAMGTARSVSPGTILVTSAGELRESNGVKRIFHAAAVQGQPGVGYKTVPDVETCVSAALATADRAEYSQEDLRTMLFPLIGTGTGGGEVRETVGRLIGTVINYFELNRNCTIGAAYFLAFTDRERDACLSVLSQAAVERVADRSR
jgi:O-acetyl-ADP-ribose deacetylase (regulator of RNase III)